MYCSTVESKELRERLEALNRSGRHPKIRWISLKNLIDLNGYAHRASFALVPNRSLPFPRLLPWFLGNAIPVGLSAFGGGLDLLNWGTSYYIPAVLRFGPEAALGEPLVAQAFWSEPEIGSLQKIMRYIFLHPREAQIRGLLLKRKGVEMYSWAKVMEKIFERLTAKRAEKVSASGKLAQLFKEQQSIYWLAKGALSLLLRDWKEAEIQISKCLDLELTSEIAKGLLARAQARSGKMDGLPWITEAVAHEKLSSFTLANWVSACHGLGEHNLRNKLLAQLEDDTEGTLLTILTLYEDGQSEEAVRLCEQVCRDKNDPTAKAILGILSCDPSHSQDTTRHATL